ncbi:uncharacterized protein TNCV_1409021 [Trichonephila clavipes]|uniref:Uncharacterized protein n=1 Tax=Trichonephila clavipes TaxID=2585209 RepID=A0A8X6R5Z4_TRICX|nr:uncharacterized protein TNCV_1409021 [Trichonephila clavipes]
MIIHLLVHTYGADPSIRDYSGKRADQYPDNYVRVVAGHKTTERRPLKRKKKSGIPRYAEAKIKITKISVKNNSICNAEVKFKINTKAESVTYGFSEDRSRESQHDDSSAPPTQGVI